MVNCLNGPSSYQSLLTSGDVLYGFALASSSCTPRTPLFLILSLPVLLLQLKETKLWPEPEEREERELSIQGPGPLPSPTTTGAKGGRAGEQLSGSHKACPCFGCRSQPRPDARLCPTCRKAMTPPSRSSVPSSSHCASHFCWLERLSWVCSTGLTVCTTAPHPGCPFPSSSPP